jgi:hypothetical protein
MSVYTVRHTDDGWRVTKFDQDLNVESSYTVRGTTCECPQAARGYCRHLDILSSFQAMDRVNTGWFLNFDSGDWLPPLDTGEPPPSPVPDGSRKSGALPSPSGFVFDKVEGIRRV